MKKNILLGTIFALVCNNLSPIVEDKAKGFAVASAACAGVLGGIISAYGLRTVLKNSNGLYDTQIKTALVSGTLISAGISYWATYKFVMSMRPSVRILKLKSFFEDIEKFFIFKLDFKYGFNETFFSTVSNYHKDKSNPFVLFRRDLANIYNGIISNKESLEKNKQDFIDSGFEQDYYYLESKLDQFKSYLVACISSVQISDLKLFLDGVGWFFSLGLNFDGVLSKELINEINFLYNGKDYPLVLFINDSDVIYKKIISKLDFLIKSKQDFISSGFESDYFYFESELNSLKLYIENCCSKVKNNEFYFLQLKLYKLEREVQFIRIQACFNNRPYVYPYNYI